METAQAYILFTLFLQRLFFYTPVKQKRWPELGKRVALSFVLSLLLPIPGEMLACFILLSLFHGIAIFFVGENVRLRYFIFILLAIFALPPVAKFLSTAIVTINFNNPVSTAVILIAGKIPLLQLVNTAEQANRLLLIATGYIFTIKESTFFIRSVLDSIKAVPQTQKTKKPQTDKDEYDRGRLIGILERLFIYFLIIVQQSALISFVLALKTFARFKELDNRNFAEYFLIGTLLSVLFAVLPALFVLTLI